MQPFPFEVSFYKVQFHELNDIDKELVMQARQATLSAYAPYSNFQVGCAILLEDATILQGFNVENAAYSSCICAERNAITTSMSMYHDKKILKIAIAHTVDHQPANKWISPCGECRQVLMEAVVRQGSDMEMYLYGTDDNILYIPHVTQLLPLGFEPKDLK